MNKLVLGVSLFFLSILSAELCRADSMDSVRELLQNPDVVSYLKANRDEWSQLTDAISAVDSAIDDYNSAVKLFNEKQSARPIAPGSPGASAEIAAISLNIQLAQQNLDEKETALAERRSRLQELIDEIRSKAIKNPQLNTRKAGSRLDDNPTVRNRPLPPQAEASPGPNRPLPPQSTTSASPQNTVELISQAESQLTSVDSQIRSRLTTSQKEALKNDEVQWIKTKDSLSGEQKLSSIQNRIRTLQQRYGTVDSSNQSTAGDRDTSSQIAVAEQELTAVYTRIRKRLTPDQKENLKQDEIKWIAKKDSMPAEQRVAEIQARIQALRQRYGD